MRTLIFTLTISLMSLGACSKEDRRDADPCERAVENTTRLVHADANARAQYGTEPLTLEHCKSAKLSKAEVACIGYASTWNELAACSPIALRMEGAGGITADRDDRVRVD